MERIFIVGYMGSGKTTVGKRLAKALSLSFVDLDAHIQDRYRKTVAAIFEEQGEEQFRKIEQKALHEVSQFEDVIISTGGGAPCFFDNMEVMNRAGTSLYIKVEPAELAARLMASRSVRPLIAGMSREELIPFISKHLAERERYYNSAHIVYHSHRMITKEEMQLTVDAIVERLKNRKRRS